MINGQINSWGRNYEIKNLYLFSIIGILLEFFTGFFEVLKRETEYFT